MRYTVPMAFLPGLLTAFWCVAAAPPQSVAVLGIEVPPQWDPALVRLLEDRVQGELVKADVFTRVVGTRDVGAVLSLEKTRQMLDCNGDGCMAEVAGALGVDLVVAGSVARLGSTNTLSLKMLDARSAVLRTSAQALSQGPPETLVALVPGAVQRMLRDGGFTVEQGPPVRRVALWAGAGVAAAAGLGAALGAVLLGLGGAVAVLVPLLVYVPTPGLAGEVRVVALPAGGLSALGLGAVLFLGVPLWLGVTVALGVMGGVLG